MSYVTVEVDLDNGRVKPRGPGTLPTKAHALLTLLESSGEGSAPTGNRAGAGLQRFLSTPDFALASEQFRASMDADFFEQ